MSCLVFGRRKKAGCINHTSLKSLSSMKAKLGTTHRFIQTSSIYQAKKRRGLFFFFLKYEVTSELGPTVNACQWHWVVTVNILCCPW